MALYMALWTTSRYLTYTTDCEAVAQGWYEKRFAQPAGLDADLWQKIGELMHAREFCDVVVLWTRSHLGPAEMLDGKGIRSLVIGNALADEFAGFAAEKARVPQAIRTRVLCHERR
eukprot:1488795-Pyramimonas_sp.AAC.1